MFKKQLFPPGKTEYIQKKRDGILDRSCILCKIVNKDEDVIDLSLYESENFLVCINLYPYNPGHLMIFPKKHIECIDDFDVDTAKEFFLVQKKCIKVLREVYDPGGFNMGFNIGKAGGASIKHIHYHIVPRYEHELGFVDILSGAKIMIETPYQMLEKLKKYFIKE